MLNKQFSVYLHISPSGKRYVGITSQKPEQRWANGLGYRRNTYFFRAIQKYGWDNFEHIVVKSNISQKEACEAESQLISLYNSSNPNYGYNLTTGGEAGTEYSKESITKMSKAAKERWTTEQSVFLQSFLSDKYVRGKMSLSAKIRSQTDEGRLEMARRGKNGARNRENTQVQIDNMCFSSISDCAIYMQLNAKTLSDYLSGKKGICQDYKDRGLSYKNIECQYEEMEVQHNKRVICDGKIYSSTHEVDEAFGLSRGSINSWLNHRRGVKIPLKFQKMGLSYIEEKRYRIVSVKE